MKLRCIAILMLCMGNIYISKTMERDDVLSSLNSFNKNDSKLMSMDQSAQYEAFVNAYNKEHEDDLDNQVAYHTAKGKSISNDMLCIFCHGNGEMPACAEAKMHNINGISFKHKMKIEQDAVVGDPAELDRYINLLSTLIDKHPNITFILYGIDAGCRRALGIPAQISKIKFHSTSYYAVELEEERATKILDAIDSIIMVKPFQHIYLPMVSTQSAMEKTSKITTAISDAASVIFPRIKENETYKALLPFREFAFNCMSSCYFSALNVYNQNKLELYNTLLTPCYYYDEQTALQAITPLQPQYNFLIIQQDVIQPGIEKNRESINTPILNLFNAIQRSIPNKFLIKFTTDNIDQSNVLLPMETMKMICHWIENKNNLRDENITSTSIKKVFDTACEQLEHSPVQYITKVGKSNMQMPITHNNENNYSFNQYAQQFAQIKTATNTKNGQASASTIAKKETLVNAQISSTVAVSIENANVPTPPPAPVALASNANEKQKSIQAACMEELKQAAKAREQRLSLNS